MFPTIEDLAPYLSERGRLEVDLALARLANVSQAERLAELEAELAEARPEGVPDAHGG
jgi:hypothetical protein